MLTTQFETEQVPMPVCRYEVLDSPVGRPVTFAAIGQPVRINKTKLYSKA